MENTTKWLYIPVETQVRELNAKLLLAFEAASRGYNVILGKKNIMDNIYNYVPKGIFLGLAVVKNFGEIYQKRVEYGHKNVSLDEEGLVFYDDKSYIRYRFSQETLEYVDVFFSWGENQERVIKNSDIRYNGVISKVGNPRFDLLRDEYSYIYSQRANEIKNKYNDFVLVNTNFASYNHFYGTEYYFNSLESKKFINDDNDVKFYKDKIKFQQSMFNEFVSLVEEISNKHTETNVIIRPHPSENIEVWKSKFKGYNNVFIIHEGEVEPWIIASKAVIHNSCTTGLEGLLLNKPSIAYIPIDNDIYNIELPNSISDQATNIKEVLHYLDYYFDDNPIKDNKQKAEILQYHVSSIKGDLAVKRMVDELDRIGCYSEDVIKSSTKRKIFIKQIIRKTKIFIYNLLVVRNFSDYSKHKFKRLEIKKVKAYYNDILKANNSYSDLLIERSFMDCVMIKKK